MRNMGTLTPALVLTGAASALFFYYSSGGATAEHSPPQSPLSAYLGFGHDVTADEQRFDEDEAMREEWIASCMAEVGFVYHPTRGSIAFAASDFADMGTPELEQYLDSDQAVDANEQYVTTLDSDRRREYYQHLIGRDAPTAEISRPDLAEEDENADGHLDAAERGDMGCLNRASVEMPGVYYAAKLLRPELNEMQDTIDRSREAALADQEWLVCMAESGFIGPERVVVYQQLEEASANGDDAIIDQFLKAETDCNAVRTAVLEPLRLQLETDFVKENEAILRDWAVPRGP